MSSCVLELNDAGIAIGDGAALRVESPAYATLESTGVVLGEAARERARIAPRQTHTRFWQRLGVEPLPIPSPHARHHADLAFRHLQQVHALAGSPAELLLAVPGSFTREQLAILLGVAERCAFRAVGLVDSALAAATQAPGSAAPLLHVELQLHQCVLTRIDHEDGQLVRREARALPGTGLIEHEERWARRASAAFIQQTRFDPLHDAASEQRLFTALPGWLARLAREDDTGAELASGTARHMVRLRASDMIEAVQPLYEELLEAVARDGAGRRVLLGARLARLPRLAARIAGAVTLEADAVLRGALAHADRIRSEDRALRFVTRLPAPPVAEGEPRPLAPHVRAQAPEPAPPPATHLLVGDHALRLAREVQYLGRAGDGAWRLLAAPGEVGACRIRRTGTGWVAEALAGARLSVDGRETGGPAALATGTRLALDGGPELRLVAELPVDDDGA